MIKSLLLALLIGLSFSSFSMRKKKQLELIKSCQIFAEKKSVFAGMNIPTFLAFNLEDGQQLYSNKNAKFGFKDFKISIEGSGQKHWRSKRKLTIATYYNAINDPYIRIKVQMIERPEIEHTFTLPIHFNGTYRIYNNASSGNSGVVGQCGREGHNGRNEYSHHNGEDGGYGEYGDHGFDGRDGNNGADVKVYVSLVDFPRDNTELVKIQSYYSDGVTRTRYLTKTGAISIYAEGGSGGIGGNGGRGGDGGNGGKGAFKSRETENDRACKNEGYGGNGGDGGSGGDGGRGGIGGNGGDVSFYFADNAWFFKNRISIYNGGGSSGSAGCGGKYGSGGKSGKGGKGNGSCGRNGRSGLNGDAGYAGRRGSITYYNWK
ncbi:MAG: hypothetical protein ACI8ZM_000786 [Crocinitomix sp.]|jgi:hypothetical protein